MTIKVLVMQIGIFMETNMEIIIRQIRYKSENLYQIITNNCACAPINFDMLLPELTALFGEKDYYMKKPSNTKKWKYISILHLYSYECPECRNIELIDCTGSRYKIKCKKCGFQQNPNNNENKKAKKL